MGNTVQITVIATDFEDASEEYTTNIERRVVGGAFPETPEDSNSTHNRIGQNKAPLLNNTNRTNSWLMEEFHLPRFKK